MKYPAYPHYKPSGMEWLGELPEHWEHRNLRFCCKSIQTGGTPMSEFLDYDGEDGLDWLTPADFNESMILRRSSRRIAPAALSVSDLKMFPTGTVLVVGIGATLGKVGLLKLPSSANQQVNALIPRDDIDSRFLAYGMTVLGDLLQMSANKATLPILNQQRMGDVPMLVPPIDEQRAIAAFLDRETARIDALIEKKRRQIELLREKRSALISHAVTKGLDPNAKMKDSGIEWLGEIPKHWEVAKFKRCAFFQEGPGLRNWQFTDSGVRVICVTNITERGIDFSNYQKFISEEEYITGYKRFSVNQGDLLLSSSGNSWGKVAEYLETETVILNTSTIRINQLAFPVLLRSFIKWVLQSKASCEQLGLMMTGACQPNFGPSHLAEIFVSVPSQNEQEEIANFLELKTAWIDALIEKVEKSIQLLREYRTALISAAVTGKIDVRNLPEPVST